MWNEHNSASYMIDDDILVDVPNGMCKYLYREGIHPSSINNILITHFHGDHYFDIPFLYLVKSRSDNKELNVFCIHQGKKKINKLYNLAFGKEERKKVYISMKINYNKNDLFKVNEYNVKKVKMSHKEILEYGYIFNKEDKSIGFTGDTTYCKNFEYMAEVCNYIFCDCMFINATQSHMGIDKLKYLTDKYPNCTFVTSHMENETRKKLKELNIKNVIVPEDGDIINI